MGEWRNQELLSVGVANRSIIGALARRNARRCRRIDANPVALFGTVQTVLRRIHEPEFEVCVMPSLGIQLDLSRCPHCGVDRPTLVNVAEQASKDYNDGNLRMWRMYRCSRCGGMVTAAARNWNAQIIECYPAGTELEDAIPDRARNYLTQALNSAAAPSGAIMLAASAVDAMLKAKDLKKGSLYDRIEPMHRAAR